jgi:hypothetical protein
MRRALAGAVKPHLPMAEFYRCLANLRKPALTNGFGGPGLTSPARPSPPRLFGPQIMIERCNKAAQPDSDSHPAGDRFADHTSSAALHMTRATPGVTHDMQTSRSVSEVRTGLLDLLGASRIPPPVRNECLFLVSPSITAATMSNAPAR